MNPSYLLKSKQKPTLVFTSTRQSQTPIENKQKKSNQTKRKYISLQTESKKPYINQINHISSMSTQVKSGKSGKIKTGKSVQFKSIIKSNLTKHTTSSIKYSQMLINDLIKNKKTRLLLKLNENIRLDSKTEYLKRLYTINESFTRLVRVCNYYKNYFRFFGNPFLVNSYFLNMLRSYWNYKAELYYKDKYKNSEAEVDVVEKKEKENIFDLGVKQEIDDVKVYSRKSI